MGPRPQGGVRCCLGKPYAPVIIVAPDAGRTLPPWNSSRGGKCCRIPRWDTLSPDLRVSGSAGSVASWGSTYQVSALLQNIGASTIIEPISQTPPGQITVGADGNPVPGFAVPSSASAASSQIAIILAPRPHSLVGAIQLGSFTAPALEQNNIEQVPASITLPTRPAGFPASGVYYIRLQANSTNTVLESSLANNLNAPIPVRFISQALPMLRTTALDVPPVMQPGDTIVPTFQITNLGTASTDTQGPVQVALVASVSPDFNLGSSIVALYTLPSGIPGASDTPVKEPRAIMCGCSEATLTATMSFPEIMWKPSRERR